MSSESQRHDRFLGVAAEVYEPLQRYLRRRVSSDDAADLLNDALLVVWRRLDDVPQDNPLPWCYGVARRTVSNHRRSSQRRLRLMERLEAEPPSPAVDPSDAQGDEELARALAGLPAWDQEIIRLWAWEQLEPREIADVLGSTPNAVSLRLSRAKKKLAASMSGQNPQASGHKEDRDTEEQRR